MEWSGSQPNFLSFLIKLTSLPVQTSFLDQLICIHGNPHNGNGIEETQQPSIYFPGNIQKYFSSQVACDKKNFLAKYHWQKHYYRYICFVICPFEFYRSIVLVGCLATGILSCAIILFLSGVMCLNTTLSASICQDIVLSDVMRQDCWFLSSCDMNHSWSPNVTEYCYCRVSSARILFLSRVNFQNIAIFIYHVTRILF